MVDRPIAKLNLRDELSTPERDLLASVLKPKRHHRAGVDLIRPGGRPDHATLLLSGFRGR